MADRIVNALYFDCSNERMKEIRNSIEYEDVAKHYDGKINCIDFEKIVPTPTELCTTESVALSMGIEHQLTLLNPDTDNFGKNKLTKSEYEKLLKKVNEEKRCFQFRGDLRHDEVYSVENAMVQTGAIAIDNLNKYGATSKEKYRRIHWNTEYNSFRNAQEGDKGIRFYTIENPPHPVILALSQKFPDIPITHEWYRESNRKERGASRYLNGFVAI